MPNAIRIPPNHQATYLPNGWDAAWISAKEDCQSAPRNILILGDSIGAGGATSDLLTTGFVPLLRDRVVAAGLPIHGDFWHTAMSAAFSAGFGGTATPMPWTLSGSPVWISGLGYGIAPVYVGAGGGPLTFTTPYACTQIDLMTLELINGTYDATMDGGAPQTITTTILSFHRRITFSGLANTTHTLVLNNQSATHGIDALGAIAYADTTKGLLFSRLTFSGNSFIGNTGVGGFGVIAAGLFPQDRLKMFQGNTTEAGTNRAFGFPMQPALAIIEMSVNDCQIGSSGDQYFAYLRRLCQALRAGYANCTILFLICSNPDGVNSDVTTTFNNPWNYGMYVHVIYDIAEIFNCGVLNIHAAWAEHGVALGYQTALDAHGTDAGHAYMANALANVLGV